MQNLKNEPFLPGQIKFFFIFAPNNSGTTVGSQYLASQINGYLPPYGNNEGQMVPAVNRMMRHRHWDTEHTFDWPFIRSKWEKLSKGQTFVEGSPPNVARFEAIAEVFGDDSSALSLISSPHQQIASCLRRYRGVGFDPEQLVER